MRRAVLRGWVLVGVLLAWGCGDDDGGPRDAAADTGGEAGADSGPDATAPQCTFRSGTITGSMEQAASPDGIGGDGDLFVESDVLRAVWASVSPEDRVTHIAASGGVLVDLHLLGRGDHLNELSQLGGVSQALQVAYTELEVVVEEPTRVVVEARGHVQPQPPDPGEEPAIRPDPGTDLRFVTRYELRCGEPVVHLSSTLRNEGTETYATSPSFSLLDVMLWGTRSLVPFCPTPGHGDACPEFEIANPIPGIVDALYVGSMGSLAGDPGTFAFYTETDGVSLSGVHDSQVSAFGLLSLSLGRLAPGAEETMARAVVVGEHADAASATDIALERLELQGLVETGVVRGRVEPPAGETLADDEHQRPMIVLATPPGSGSPTDPSRWTPRTAARVDATGAFSARVPAGRIAWELRAPGRAPTRGDGGTVEVGGTLDLETLPLEEAGSLRVVVRDASGATPAGLPARVVVVGTGDTADPVLGDRSGGSPAGNTALTDGDGEAILRLPPGTYDIYATHGPFYTLARAPVTVAAGEAEVTLEIERLPVVPDGFVSADFHVHSGASFDSSLPLDTRVRAFLAEGVDAIVATEHDVIFDYAPTLTAVEAGLPPSWRGRLRTFAGIESTGNVPFGRFPHTIGHHNAFPLRPIPGSHKNGAPVDEHIDVGTLYDRLRALPTPADVLVQLNHARASRAGRIWLGYFDGCGYDPAVPFDPESLCFADSGPAGSRPYDFDAMEVINGKDGDGFVRMSRDWYGLLLQSPGAAPVGTANSDSHSFVENAGYPLTLLRTGAPLAALDDAALVAALRGGAVAGSLGVVIWGTAREVGGADGVEPGRAPLRATSGRVELDLRVAASPWFPVEEVRIRLGGRVVRRLTRAAGELSAPEDPFGTDGVVRFEGTVVLDDAPLSADSFLTVEAGFALGPVADLDGDGNLDATDNDGDGDVDADDLPGGIDVGASSEPLRFIAPGARPMGFTNPIFVDVDGNGRYDAPGVPLID